MKKVTSLKKFTIILSIGTVISFLGKLPFRFIAVIVLSGSNYSIFALVIQTFNLLIPIGALELNNPFTRELRKNTNSDNIKLNFAVSFIITGIFGVILILIITILILKELSFFLLTIISLALFLRCFSKYFLAIVRAKGFAIKSAMISSLPAIIQGIIIFPFFFNIKIFLTLQFFILLYCLYLSSYFFIGFSLTKSIWKSSFRSIRIISRNINLKDSFKNIENGLYLSLQSILNSLVNWLLTFIAIQILNSNLFRIFDLCLYIVSFISIFGSNLSLSTLSISDTEKVSKNPLRLLSLFISGIILTLIFNFLIIPFIPLEWFLKISFNLDLSLEGKNIIRISVFIPLFIYFWSYLDGKIQALGRYKKVSIGSFLSFLGFLTFLTLGFFIKSGGMLMIGFILYNCIKIVFSYYFIHHNY